MDALSGPDCVPSCSLSGFTWTMQLDCDPPSQNRELTCSCDGLHAWEDHFEHQTTAQTTQEVTTTQATSLTALLETSAASNRDTTVQETSTNANSDTTIQETSTDVYRETTIQETSPDLQSTAVAIHQTSSSTHSRSGNIQETTLAAAQESSIASGEPKVALDTSTASPVTEADDITQSTPATLELSRSTDTVMTNSITPKPHIPHTVVSTRVPDVTSDVTVFPAAQMTTFSSTHKTTDTEMEHSTRPARGGYMTTATTTTADTATTTADTATTAMKQLNRSGEILL